MSMNQNTTPDYAARLKTLRDELKIQKLDGFLVPMADEFQCEIAPPSAQRIAFLTGFTGSSALVIAMHDKAVFFTDGRYTLQASHQLPKGLYTLIDFGQTSPADWLKDNTRAHQVIGFDPWLHTEAAIERIRKALAKTGAELKDVRKNPVDMIWMGRPTPPCALIYAHDIAYAGKTSVEKRKALADELKKDGLNAMVITDPASIAWLLNVRGDDLPFTPAPLSFAILRNDASVEWFVDPKKITAGLDDVLGSGIIRFRPEEFGAGLARLGEAKARVRVDPHETAHWVFKTLSTAGATIERGDNPCALPKACKNPTEINGMRAAHRRDGASLCRLLAWLNAGHAPGTLTEIAVEQKLHALRAENQFHRGPSFATIAGAGANAAIVHYRATEASNAVIQPDMLFLLDSGAHYFDGTTDVTRTIAIGQPLREMRDRFTRVLKGHIALASIIFPEGTTGAELDVLARQHLWSIGLDYNHGTGHGVGSYLSVHEGPQNISRRGNVPLKEGMVVSNEPGFYKAGHYGIRIENLQAVVERIELSSVERKMFGFETLTLVPIDRRLIDAEMLTKPERLWLDDYHARVRQALRPLADEATARWLMEATEPI